MEAWAEAWLAQLAKMIAGVSKGIVILGTPQDGPLVPAACWPDPNAHTDALVEAAEQAMSERGGVIHAHKLEAGVEERASAGAELENVAIPFLMGDRLCGAIAFEVPARPEPQQRAILKLLRWGAVWLEMLLGQRSTSDDRVVAALKMVALCLEHARFQAAATAVATELATRLECERVSLGFLRGRHIQVQALSHSARFDAKSNLISDLGDAMDEAMDQQATVVHPAPSGAPPQLIRAHEKLGSEHGARALCTVPLSAEGELLGGLTLERTSDRIFDRKTVELCEQVAGLVGPILELKRREDRRLVQKVGDTLRCELAKLVGPGHLVWKGAAALAALLLIFLTVANGTFRIAATAKLEGTDQRVIVASLDGFISEAHRRAGDVVRRGEVLGRLDDKDLRLERVKWASKREQLSKEHRGAFASHDAAQVRILSAQLDQADAQLELLDEQIARTRLVAPFDGVVVTGDLSQLLGSPVEKGEVLFKIAPLDDYRVILEVDERDIAHALGGQRGRLALSAIPGVALPFAVEKITPVSTAQGGRNFFRVEARLDEAPGSLRPGMEGIGKIEVGRRKRIWIWTHRLLDWIRFWLWSWSP